VTTGFGRELDARTLARARHGDMAAFADIYEHYGRACYNLALRILGERSAAEDVVQEVFLKVMDAVKGYRGDAPFGAWLKRLTTNATIDALRSARQLSHGGDEGVLDTIESATAAPDAGTEAWSLLMRLPPRARAVLVLHEIEGYTHAELAGMFGRTESYSKSILARALQRLGNRAGAPATKAGPCATGRLKAT
jgi:RNA polymerase sigma-70 factor (ECF subfamily)